MRCPSCKYDNPLEHRFCERCGTQLEVCCPQCQHPIRPGTHFCGACGHRLVAPAMAAASVGIPPSSLSPIAYTPGYLTEKILTSKSALEGERKQVTVLFADLKSSMELLAERDPEEARQLLDPVLERMMAAVHRYEGTVNQVMGDGIMALFGAPVAHEDHAIRACYAALVMQAAVQQYAAEVQPTYGVPVHIRVGLNAGEVVVRAIHSDLHIDYTAVGQTTHLAARMEQMAQPGSILITAEVLALAEGYVEVTSLGLVPIRGLREPVTVYEVTGAGPMRTRLQVATARGLTPFVGRATELATLQRALERASAGYGQAVACVGEPGIGKTRLFYEFTRSPRTHGWCVLESSATSYGQATPYLPIIDLLKAYFQTTAHDDVDKVRDKVRGKLLSLDAAFLSTLPVFLALLEVPVVDPQWQALEALQRRQRTLDAIKRLLLRESLVQPLLLVLENLHWIDTETQAFLDSLLESLPTAHILLLVNYRPEYQQGWGSKTYSTQIQLDSLRSASAEAFFQTLLGEDISLAPLKQRLIERTEGNPFFLEESVRTLVETGVLMGERGAYRLAKTLPSVQVPATVQAVLAARIDRLPPEDKGLLEAASVLGKNVSCVLLQAIAEMSEEALHRSLDHLQTAEFLYETHLFPELEYTFKHALTCEVAYGSLLERRRRAYHATVGRTLEKLYAGRTDEVLEQLAYHFGRSVEHEKAVDYVLLAAEKAQQRWAHVEAMAHFEVARTRLAAMPDTASNRLRRIDAVLKQGEVQFALGRHAEHIAALEEIHAWVDKADDPRRRATWCYWMGYLHSFTGSRPEVARTYCREAAAIAEAYGFDDFRALADSCLVGVYNVAGALQEALAAGERALATFEARGNIWWACRTLWQLSTTANAMGAWEQSLGYCHRALEHGRAVDDLRLKVVALWRTGSTLILQGDPTAGLQWCEQALALAPIPYDAAMAKAARGHGLVKVGKVTAGMAELAEAVAWFERSHLPYTRAIFALRLGEACLLHGERLRAQTIFEEVLATSQEWGYQYLEGVASRFLGEVLTPEAPEAATGHLEAAARILEEVGARNEHAKVLVVQAMLRQTVGDPAGARQCLEHALALFEAMGTLDGPLHVRSALAALE